METLYTNIKRKLQHHSDRILSIQQQQVAPPINVEIDLSNRCTLGCEWCHFGHTHTRGPLATRRNVEVGDLMSTELAKSIVEQLAEYQVRSITWTGGGEPTLHPDYLEILNDTAVAGIDQGIYTNGCHITKLAAETLGNVCSWIYVSLDCDTEDEYCRVKRTDLFQNACRGIRHLARTGATVGVGFLLGPDKWQNAARMARLGVELGASYVQFRPSILFDTLRPSEPVGDVSWVADFLGHDHAWPADLHIECDRQRFESYANWQGHGYSVCHWSALQTVVTPNGHVWTCCNKRGEAGESLGDLTTELFAAIWSRREIADVNDRCRLMCRGHVGNLVLHDILSPTPHANFV